MSGPPQPSEGRWLGLSAAFTAVVFWSTGNLIVRTVDLPGVQVAFWRIGLAAAVYWALLVVSGRRLTWRHLAVSAPAGLALGAEIGIFFVALKATTIANATLIGALQPIVLLVFGARRFGEKVPPWILGLSLVALSGVALVVLGSSDQPIWSPRGDLLAVAAMVLFAAYYVLAKEARQSVPALEFQTAIWIWGSLLLLPGAIIDAGGIVLPSATNWVGIVVLLAIPGTGHFLMNWAHASIQLTSAAVLSLGIPVLSILGAAAFLDEPLTGWQIPGVAIVIVVLAVIVRHGPVASTETREGRVDAKN